MYIEPQSRNVNGDHIAEIVSTFGRVIDVSPFSFSSRSSGSGGSGGSGGGGGGGGGGGSGWVVGMASPADASLAVERLDGAVVDGKPVIAVLL